ncbi:MAG: hypothetical protein ACTSVO_12260 [Candidatus Heimdallarchaeaceae archaeon]
MNKRIKQISFSIVVCVSLLSLISIPAAMDSLEESLIVSIIDADYPPIAGIREGRDHTIYGVDLVYQVENPTDDDVRLDTWCSPIPFPHLETNMENKSIVVYVVMIFEWPVGTYYIPPGIKNNTFHFEIMVEDYKEETLPAGEYSLWFDYTNCSIVAIPVIVEKLIIHATEDNVTYFFEHDSREEVYTFEATYFGLFSLCTILIVTTFVQRKRKKNN